MIQAGGPLPLNKTVNYEMYTGRGSDRFECPQNTHLVNRKDFVYSINYPPGTLNLSQFLNEKNNEKRRATAKSHSALEVEDASKAKTLNPIT